MGLMYVPLGHHSWVSHVSLGHGSHVRPTGSSLMGLTCVSLWVQRRLDTCHQRSSEVFVKSALLHSRSSETASWSKVEEVVFHEKGLLDDCRFYQVPSDCASDTSTSTLDCGPTG